MVHTTPQRDEEPVNATQGGRSLKAHIPLLKEALIRRALARAAGQSAASPRRARWAALHDGAGIGQRT
jgi:hypothetical protein